MTEPFDYIINFLKETNELQAAKDLLKVIAKYSQNVSHFDSLGRWYCEIKDYDQSLYWTQKALTLAPDNETMQAERNNLAKLHNHRNEPEQALFYLKLNPVNHDNLLETVFSLFLLNRKEESEQILRDLIKETLPKSVMERVLFNLGTYDLMHGKFKEGLYGFLIVGKELGIWKKQTLDMPFWSGGIRPGKSILVLAEGGIGDEFINIRFMNHLKDYGMNPVWYTSREDLRDLFIRCGFPCVSTIVPCDLWTYSMSLPLYLDLSEHQLWSGPYITYDQERYSQYNFSGFTYEQDEYPQYDFTGLKVGIKWSGNPDYEQDLHRQVPVKEIVESLSGLNVSLYSLQKETSQQDYEQIYKDVIDLSQYMKTYDDTLAIMAHMDVIITSCTSIAHAASAMGLKVIVLVPIAAYYTWCSTTDTSSIWYGENTIVLRQSVHKSWKEPLSQLRDLMTTNFT
jgi:tetratricopeptide (TPR) repeat protein